jgi:hypothetical protein
MEESAIIFKKYFKRLYDEVGIEWTEEDTKQMEKLSEVLRREATKIKKGDKVLIHKTKDGEVAHRL